MDRDTCRLRLQSNDVYLYFSFRLSKLWIVSGRPYLIRPSTYQFIYSDWRLLPKSKYEATKPTPERVFDDQQTKSKYDFVEKKRNLAIRLLLLVHQFFSSLYRAIRWLHSQDVGIPFVWRNSTLLTTSSKSKQESLEVFIVVLFAHTHIHTHTAMSIPVVSTPSSSYVILYSTCIHQINRL